MTDDRIRIHFGDPQNGMLVCAHCKLSHMVPLRTQQHFETKAREMKVPLSAIWECGGCYIAHLKHLGMFQQSVLSAIQPGNVRTDCTHPVPPFEEPP